MKYLTKDFVSSATDVPMMARLVRPGEGYGQWNKAENDFVKNNESDEMLVEFHDRRYGTKDPFDAQFVSRYYLGTLKESVESPGGLCLDGGVSDWNIGEKEFKEVVTWAQRIEKKMGLKSEPLRFPNI